MADTKFIPEHRSVDAMLVDGATYQVPAYQRPYVWDCRGKTDRDSQVVRLWEDLWGFFSEDATKSREYFLGSVVVIERSRLTFEVIDGQQRLTSLILVLAAMSCFIKRLQSEPKRYDDRLIDFLEKARTRLDDRMYNQVGVQLIREPKVKIERSAAHAPYDVALAEAVACYPGPSTAPRPRHREVVERYFRNREYLRDRLEQHLTSDGFFGTASATLFNDFYVFLLQRVSIVQIRTSSEDTAFTVFEILNNRGMPLSNLDLLRNFVLQQLAKVDDTRQDEHERRWDGLENDGADDEFVARWVESYRGKALSASAFNETREVYKTFTDLPGSPPIAQLLDRLEADLAWYRAARQPEEYVEDLEMRARVLFLLHAGNARYLVNLMLALFRATGFDGRRRAEEADRPVRAVLAATQRYLTAVLLGRVRFSNAVTFDAINHLRRGDFDGAVSALSEASGREQVYVLVTSPIYDNTTAALFVATVSWLEEADAHTGGDAVGAWRLSVRASSLEHILPRGGSRWGWWSAAAGGRRGWQEPAEWEVR
jgi:hypothetical protein